MIVDYESMSDYHENVHDENIINDIIWYHDIPTLIILYIYIYGYTCWPMTGTFFYPSED